MISELELNIYQTLFQEKKLTEKYIGKVEFDWLYSEIHYTAECTVGVPFDLFDKTIVGILLVDEVLPIEEIGDILGMNVIDNPENQQYRDDAEYDILRMALDNLYQYKIIEIGDTSYSSCKLTSIGKEYAQKGRKLKIENNKPFSLIYDHTSQNHIEAKSLFKDFKGKNQLSVMNDFDFLDETLMKQMAAKQASEIYDEQKENSFTNPQMDENKSQSFSLKIFAALLYDLENGNIRLLAYEPITKTINEHFTNWLNENKLEEIIRQLQHVTSIDSPLPTLSQEYIQTLVQTCKEFDREIVENPMNAIVIANKANQSLEYIDVEYFWNNLNAFVEENTKEYWFFIPEPDMKILSIIEVFAENCPSISVFVSINNTNNANLAKQITKLKDKSRLYNNNLFVEQVEFKEILKNKFWKVEDTLLEYNENFVLLSDPFFFNSFVKMNTNITASYKGRKYYFAKNILPLLKENILQITSKEIKIVNKAEILLLQTLDKKALILTDLQEHEDVLQQIFEIENIKNKFIATYKEKHNEHLKTHLDLLVLDFEKQEFSKLEPLQEFGIKLQKIHNELFEDYIDLQREVADFENKIHTEEKRIKDEILSKTYIIDTNIFIEEPEIISKIESKHDVVLSHTVINELDKLKQKDRLKEKASKAITTLNKVLGKNKQLRTAKANTAILDEDYQQNSPDNRILSVAFIYKDKNPILLTNDNGLQLKAKSIGIPIISLKELLGEKPEPMNIKNNTNGIDYKNIFKQMHPNKNGKYQINGFIELLKKKHPEFDYKALGFEKAWQFVESLGSFKVTEKQFLNLNS